MTADEIYILYQQANEKERWQALALAKLILLRWMYGSKNPHQS
jgi:hypothetical protein